MGLIRTLRKILPETHPIRLFYHQIKGFLAALIYMYPASKMTVIGVTGTKGKTTTVNLIALILQEAGHKVGIASTINFQIDTLKWANLTKQTTMSPFFMQKLLKRMVKAGCTHCVLEVSSHAITQSRVSGINFDTAVMTNISEDHIEYHGDFTSYLHAKGTLFKNLNRSRRKPNVQKVSVINNDDEYFEYFDSFIVDTKYNYGLKKGTCYASNIVPHAHGTKFVLHIPNNQIEVNIKLPGEVNISNALAASTVALATNINIETIKAGLEKAEGIPGRMESIDVGQPYSIIVDYAHTPESLEKLLELYRRITEGKLYVVFGATGGGRDKAKRPKMGEIAQKYADYIVVTNDDPYEEDEMQIIEQISEGIEKKEGENLWKIPHRYEAIRLALTMAGKHDTVVIAGKGCEEIQIIGTEKIPWDDRKVVRELLSRKITVEIGANKTEERKNVCMEG